MIGVVGSGPSVEAVEAALGDLNATVTSVDADRLDAADFAVVAGVVGDETFDRANRAALRGDTPWLAVEVGGVGGRPLSDVDAAVSGFAPGTACYACLRARVSANAEETADRPEADRSDARLAGALAGREAVSLLDGAESHLLGGVIELPHAERTVLPLPRCEHCGGEQSRTLALDDAPSEDAGGGGDGRTSLDDAVSRAERAVDERVGVVRTVGELESFPAPYYLATNADTAEFSDATAPEHAAGVAADWDAAFMKAVGEALERYSAGVYRNSEFTVALPAEIDAAVPPASFVRPDDWPDARADEPIPWVEGVHLDTGDVAALPAEFVQFPPPEARFKPSITTGLGLGNSAVEAVLSGLYEVVERDAAMLGWYSTFDPLGLAVEDEEFDALADRAGAEGLAVTPLLLTQDVDVPVVAVAVHREGEWPRFAVGSGANLDPDAAARSALAEALQNWMELRSMGAERAADEDGAIGRYASFPDPARELVAVEHRVPSDSVGPERPPTGRAELDAVVERAVDADLGPYVARLTPRDVETVGFEAVRVLVPRAQPLFTGESYFGERARTVPRELGFRPLLDREPHPFP